MPVADESATFSPGDEVSGRYRIVHFVAKGGMGEVYEALDLELNTSVALKTLLPENSRSEELISRLKREIQLARQVTLPLNTQNLIFEIHQPATLQAQFP